MKSKTQNGSIALLVIGLFETKYSRADQIKLEGKKFKKTWSDTISSIFLRGAFTECLLVHFEVLCPTLPLIRSSHHRCSERKDFLEISQNSQENICARACKFIKKETLVQAFSCEFCEISKNTFLQNTSWRPTASAWYKW